MVSPKFVVAAWLALAVPVAAQDVIPVGAVVWHGGAADLASWPATFSLTHVELQAASDIGFSFQFSPDRCPNTFVPPTPVSGVPWTGPIKYTVFAGFNLNGQIHLGGFVQMWPDRRSTGAPILTDNNWARNWAYDTRWGQLSGVVPAPGQTLYLMLACGNGRAGQVPETAVRERSNIIAIRLPEGGSGAWDFPLAPPVVTPPVTPPPIQPPAPTSGYATAEQVERLLVYQEQSNAWQQRIADWLHEEAVREHESDIAFNTRIDAALNELKAAINANKGGGMGTVGTSALIGDLVLGLINALKSARGVQ